MAGRMDGRGRLDEPGQRDRRQAGNASGVLSGNLIATASKKSG